MKRQKIKIAPDPESHAWLSEVARSSRHKPGVLASHAADVLKIVALYCQETGRTWEAFRSELLAFCPDPSEPSGRPCALDRRGLRFVSSLESDGGVSA